MSRLVVSCIRGGRAGARFQLDQDRVTLGRRPDNDIAFDAHQDRKASGRHAELSRVGERWLLRDLGSTNGTFLGGVRVEAEVEVADGANIELGKDGPVLHVRIVRGPPVDDATVLAEMPDILAPPPSTGRTGVYRAMMVEAVSTSSRKLKWMIAVLAVLLVGGAAVAAFTILTQKQDLDAQKQDLAVQKAETQQLRAKAERLREDAEALRSDATTAREEQRRLTTLTTALQQRLKSTREALDTARSGLDTATGRLAELRTRLSTAEGKARVELQAQARSIEADKKKYETQLASHSAALERLRETENAAEVIAFTYERTLFMLIADMPRGQTGFCTAFAISTKGLLVTNSHCVQMINDARAQGRKTIARMNRNPDKAFDVIRWKRHPSYRDTPFSADVALLKVDLRGGSLPVAARLADDDTARSLKPGQTIYTMGFPGKVMNEKRPAADFRAAVISRITNYDNSPASVREAQVVWHSALTSKGTSGSPLFNVAGEVVAVNNGGLSARRVYERDARTGMMRTTYAYDATGLNFGIRVDVLREMLEALDVDSN